jgi:chemotaxis protein methyltransferase CheR
MNSNEKEIDLDSLVRYACELVSLKSGNVLEDEQHSMVCSRIKKRIIDLSLNSYQDYFQFIKNNLESESKKLVSMLTTHHTFFFREFYHFEYLINNLQSIVNNVRDRGESKIRVYSAACSRGQEVYSIAMFFNVMLKRFDPQLDFEIVGTDIDEECITRAVDGVYNYNEIKKIPEQFLKGHFERGKGDLSNLVRVKKEIKDKCRFYSANIFDKNHIKDTFDIIFCRNVFIYFKQDEIHQVVDIFRSHINKNGFFVTGLCESLKPLQLKNLFHRGICIYSFDEETPAQIHEISTKRPSVDVCGAASVIPSPIRVMIVDDSKSIQKILLKIFSNDPDFEVVAVADDGVHAENLLKINKVDAMTLDIHMPNKSGVEYLKDNYSESHPKVVVVSSANREDSESSVKAIEYGAKDFVEKPSLNNMTQKAQEIKNKIKMSFLNVSNTPSSIHNSFQARQVILEPKTKLRVLLCSKSSEFKLEHFVKEMGGAEPPCVILYEGNEPLLESYVTRLSTLLDKKVQLFSEKLEVNTLYIADTDSFLTNNIPKLNMRKLSICLFGVPSKGIESKISKLKGIQLLVEDIDGVETDLKDIADEIFPYTSYYFTSTKYLGEKI